MPRKRKTPAWKPVPKYGTKAEIVTAFEANGYAVQTPYSMGRRLSTTVTLMGPIAADCPAALKDPSIAGKWTWGYL